MLRTVTITVAIIATLSMFGGCKAREDKPTDETASKDKPINGTTSEDTPTSGTASKDEPANGTASKDKPANGATSKDKPPIVTGIERDALLKFVGITPFRVEAFEYGWLVISQSQQRLSSFRIAVCRSSEEAQALYQYSLTRRSVGPPVTIFGLPPHFKVGDQCVIYRSNITFVRDNIFVGVGWRSGIIDHRLIKRLDDLLRSESAIVKRGHFTEVAKLQFTEAPELKIVQEPVVVVVGERKKLQVAWSGMGEKQPMFYVSSPGWMSNFMVDATDQLILTCTSPGERYPVTVYAVGEGLVFTKATMNVITRSAQTQPSSTQPGESGMPPATRSNESSRREKTP